MPLSSEVAELRTQNQLFHPTKHFVTKLKSEPIASNFIPEARRSFVKSDVDAEQYDSHSTQAWRSGIKFANKLEYDYFFEIDCNQCPGQYGHEHHNLYDKDLGISYNFDGHTAEKCNNTFKFTPIKKGSNNSKDIQNDLILQWDEINSFLNAINNCKSTIFCKHYLSKEETQLKNGETVKLFNLKDLYQKLKTKDYIFEAIPDTAHLRFVDESGKHTVKLSISSRVVGVLYEEYN